ncbi:MAG: GntP family permease, partial [Planctomycetaceae bacterium]
MSETWVTLAVILAGVAVVVGSVLWLRLHAFLALVFGALVVGGLTPRESLTRYYVESKKLAPEAAAIQANKNLGVRIAQGFGDTCISIGILIAMAAIVGKCLLDSGAADRIVRTALRLFGERAAPLAFLLSGFTLGIPVFFDTVFYLMIPLGKAMSLRTGRNYLLYVLTIVCGASMAHSLVPPTPGPLFVAEALGVDLGTMMVAGCIVGLFSATTGCLYAYLANRLWTLPLRESPEFSLKDLKQSSELDESLLPPLWLSLLPILLPVVLIAGQTFLEEGLVGSGAPPALLQAAATHGDKTIAMTIAAVVAMATLVRQNPT